MPTAERTARENAKKAQQTINIMPILTLTDTPDATTPGTQVALAIKAPKPTKLRINTVQGKALAKEMVEKVKDQIRERKTDMRLEQAYILAQQKYMETDPLAVALVALDATFKTVNIRSVNKDIERYNDNRLTVRREYANGGYYNDRVGESLGSLHYMDVSSQLKNLRENYFNIYYAKELEEFSRVSVDFETLYNRIMVKTITFTNAGTLEQFQRETISELYPAVARLVPSMDPELYTAEGELRK